MFCNMCGHQLPDDSKFCVNCGAKVVISSSQSTQVHPDSGYSYVPSKGTAREVIYEPGKRPDILNTRKPVNEGTRSYCNNCGSELKPDASFCVQCGKAVEGAVPSDKGRRSTRKATTNVPDSSQNKHRTGQKRQPASNKSALSGMFRVLRVLIIAMLLGGILVVVGEKIDERNYKERAMQDTYSERTEETMSSEEATLAERLPDVPEHLRTVQVLQHRGMGSCKALKGNIAVTVVFVDDAASNWTQQEIDEFTGELYVDISELTNQALQWGVELNITIYTGYSSLDYEVEPASASYSLGPILSSAGYAMYNLSDSMKQETGANAVPFVIALNKEGRSYANQNPDEADIQACYLFSGSDAFKHELLHLFGAADFYYHDLMSFAVSDILDESIMCDSANDHVDDLTAYLVGWTDQLTNEAETMLYIIGYIGNDELQSAQEENMLTGFGTLKLDGGGSYSGYLSMGVPDGWGEMIFANGDTYSGEFDNGAITGYGCIVWISGDRYEGYFQDGQLHGQGTLTKTNGEIYSGTWVNSEFKG